MSGKRLFQGGLIALIWESGGDVSVHLGTIASSTRDLSDYVKQDKEHVKFGVVFFDPSLELKILQELRNPHTSAKGTKILVESPVMFEAIRPFLEALRTEPEDVPFSRYLVLQPHERLASCALEAPRYARLPKFQFRLDSLFHEDAGVENLMLSVADPVSIDCARRTLRSKSRLDPSQADAVIDTLTREVALIQGPPGTGKSFTGVEIIRVLKANNVRPILLIAFTNHALDHMLSSILDADITQRIVRLGRRVNDGPIAPYSIETLEMVQKQTQSRLDRTLGNCRRELKVVEEQIRDLMNKVLSLNIDNNTGEIMKYLSTCYPEHFEYLSSPPPWVSNIKGFVLNDEDDAGEWQTAGRGGKAHDFDRSTYAFWRDSSDLAFIDQITNGSLQPWKFPPGVKICVQNPFSALTVEEVDDNYSSDEELSDTDSSVEEMEVEESWKVIQFDQVSSMSASDPLWVVLPPTSETRPPLPVNTINHGSTIGPADVKDMDGFFDVLGFDHTPSVPQSDRPLEELLEDVGDVWEMSLSERQRIHAFWAENARIQLGQTYMDEFQRLRDRHADKLRECNEGKEEVRRSLLHSMDIIACTTTAIGLSPKVLLVEEAGQVMEAHILGSLVPSIEHLILIGDPLQLRPTLNNYSLSVESKQGQIYKFDMSLMERLSTSGLTMSRIDVQRRMRPMISSLIRNTLYPGLEDHKLVKEYPDVRGIQQNVFFVSHSHRENEGGDDSASKYNMYEVCCYSNEGDIVVLCAYLGQLARLRDALANDVAISIDERDQAALADQESERDQDVIGGATIERVNVTKRVRLRTVDNYQGEEGRIVILSLVRNSGNPEDENGGHSHRANIGFLKSENRTNVALSRAREGLYIFGHAQNLSSRSGMWGKIIEELEEKSLVGPALPIACHRHPDVVKYVSEPGQLPQFAPDGGCLENCESRLNCGHLCPFKCHCDDPNHVAVTCSQPCRRLCARDHPCQKDCRYDCGQCQFKVANVQLPCGHTKASVPCWQLDSLGEVFCDFKMEKDLPLCEHTAIMSCGQDPSDYSCLARCDRLMECCSKICRSRCHECQTDNVKQEDGKVARAQHRTHPCEKRLHCSHPCRAKCSSSHEHTKRCMERLSLTLLGALCSLSRTMWMVGFFLLLSCDHYSCPVPCGSICVRLPCDKPCKKPLKCGHACPSVCGEDCNIQVCPECASANQKSQVVDLILQRSLEDVLPESGDMDEMIITIPACRHVFTVETLDGLTGMNDFYSRDINNTKWTGLLAPLGFTNPPTCPTCRSPITCPRYGRIVKRADLDILERNVAAHMSQSLDTRQQALQGINDGALKVLLAAEAATITIPEPKDPPKLAKQKTSRKKLLGTGKSPASERDIQASNSTLHFMDSKVLSIWRKATHQLFAVYKDIVKITERRYAHTKAWEASLSLLFEREIQAGLENPATLPRNPREHAMRMARIYIGQPRPLADRRFLVEAFWVTLHIRLTLIGLAQT
ncbi:P-loop containing nucleoside triphosphate hydrolase protein, partial [Phlegmacium glaucopus]